jgi:segregation and condensation protein A
MPQSFAIATPHFEGPLESLLNLIEERKLSISDISLAEVTDAYLAYVEKLPELPLGETAQFILVASTLLLIKSRALLPTLQLSEEERESVEELERRLARYALIRKAAKGLRGAWGARPLLLAKRPPAEPVTFSPAESSIARIAEAAEKLLAILPTPAKLAEAAVAPMLALEEVVTRVQNRLTSALRTRFSELTKSADKHEVIVYFLAMLELVRHGSVSVTQDKLFSDITLELEEMGAPRYGASTS